MRFAMGCAVLALMGCNGTCPGQRISSGLQAGSGTMSVVEVGGTFAQAGFEWIDESSPGVPNHAEFKFTFDGGAPYPIVLCDVQDWSALVAASQPADLASVSCSVVTVEGTNDFAAADLAGTITAVSNLDAKGNGTITIQLDVPSTPWVVDGASYHGDVELVGLRGTATFGTVACSSSNSNGFW